MRSMALCCQQIGMGSKVVASKLRGGSPGDPQASREPHGDPWGCARYVLGTPRDARDAPGTPQRSPGMRRGSPGMVWVGILADAPEIPAVMPRDAAGIPMPWGSLRSRRHHPDSQGIPRILGASPPRRTGLCLLNGAPKRSPIEEKE